MKCFFRTINMVFFPRKITLQKQKTELERVQTTLNYYLNGLVKNNYEQLKKAFRPNSSIKWIDTQYHEANAVDTLVERLESFSRKRINTEIISIDISGNAASARLEIQLPAFTFIDYIHLLKIDSNWEIVSNIYYKKELKNTLKRF
ncbi:nuclear transport factor 2 family protein [uncultured Dokdonia sp.]|uniref:nuclear transport factor 2 family protein n=1 Tax=uncultured Dokdonia sp. TaxID=575653 RepID=UPI002618AD0B|nr:nuclear transport factor 2 family protein [uncultured Dokdonia sp.]